MKIEASGAGDPSSDKKAFSAAVPKLDRTMTDVYTDELYNPCFRATSEAPSSSSGHAQEKSKHVQWKQETRSFTTPCTEHLAASSLRRVDGYWRKWDTNREVLAASNDSNNAPHWDPEIASTVRRPKEEKNKSREEEPDLGFDRSSFSGLPTMAELNAEYDERLRSINLQTGLAF